MRQGDVSEQSPAGPFCSLSRLLTLFQRPSAKKQKQNQNAPMFSLLSRDGIRLPCTQLMSDVLPTWHVALPRCP